MDGSSRVVLVHTSALRHGIAQLRARGHFGILIGVSPHGDRLAECQSAIRDVWHTVLIRQQAKHSKPLRRFESESESGFSPCISCAHLQQLRPDPGKRRLQTVVIRMAHPDWRALCHIR